MQCIATSITVGTYTFSLKLYTAHTDGQMVRDANDVYVHRRKSTRCRSGGGYTRMTCYVRRRQSMRQHMPQARRWTYRHENDRKEDDRVFASRLIVNWDGLSVPNFKVVTVRNHTSASGAVLCPGVESSGGHKRGDLCLHCQESKLVEFVHFCRAKTRVCVHHLTQPWHRTRHEHACGFGCVAHSRGDAVVSGVVSLKAYQSR